MIGANVNATTVEPCRLITSQIYRESGIMHIRSDGEVETKPNGQKKTGGSRPAFSNMNEQVEYGKGSGRC